MLQLLDALVADHQQDVHVFGPHVDAGWVGREKAVQVRIGLCNGQLFGGRVGKIGGLGRCGQIGVDVRRGRGNDFGRLLRKRQARLLEQCSRNGMPRIVFRNKVAVDPLVVLWRGERGRGRKRVLFLRPVQKRFYIQDPLCRYVVIPFWASVSSVS